MKPEEPEIPDLVLDAPQPAAKAFTRPSAAPTRSVTPTPGSSATPRGTWGASSSFGGGGDLELGHLSEDPLAGAGQMPVGGNEIDLFSDDLGSTDLGLDLERAYTPEPTATKAKASIPPHSGERQRSNRPAPLAWPTGRTEVAEELDIDPLEVSITAGYDDAPQSLVLMPFYAVRVFMRRQRLSPEEQAARARLSRAEKARDELLVELAESSRPLLAANDRLRTMLVALGESETLAAERTNALSRASADVAGTESELDAKLASIDVERDLAKKEASTVELLLGQAEEALKRVELQAKRIDIEKRSVLDVARQKLGPAGGALPPELAAKVNELDQRRAALNPELEDLRKRRDAAKRDVDAVLGKERSLSREARMLTEAKQDYRARQQGELDVRARGVSEAEEQRRAALVAVAQRVLELRGEVPVDGARLEALTAADDAVARELFTTEKLRRALDSYDFDAAKKGRVVLIACCALSALSILFGLLH